MLRLPPFRLLRPRTLAEAARLLVEEGAADQTAVGPVGSAGTASSPAGSAGTAPPVRLVAGGTDLWPNMKRRHQRAAAVVSLMGVPELAGIRNGGGAAASGPDAPGRPDGPAADAAPGADGAVRIGATTLLDDVARHPLVAGRYPALAAAVASISSPPLRNMGTIGGNLCVDTRCTYYNQTEEWRRSIDYCMKAEGTICWVATSSPRCWAHSASDSAPMLCALGAGVRLASARGERVVPVAGLYRDDGIDYLARRPDEILAEIELPADAGRDRCRSAFWKLRRRGSIDFAVLSVAAAVWTDAAGDVSRARIYLGAVGSAPVAAEAAAELLVGQPLRALAGDQELLAAAGRLVRKAATPMDNTDFQAQWRGVMAARYAEAALRELAGGERQRLAPRHPLPAA
ncbi:MAG TPA: FAD binding domain-containing protein [Thermoanaerobaculia bacterium]|nr:FAD binding domain-containing protein [Thermoanaerobaculia bacterium]